MIMNSDEGKEITFGQNLQMCSQPPRYCLYIFLGWCRRGDSRLKDLDKCHAKMGPGVIVSEHVA